MVIKLNIVYKTKEKKCKFTSANNKQCIYLKSRIITNVMFE